MDSLELREFLKLVGAISPLHEFLSIIKELPFSDAKKVLKHFSRDIEDNIDDIVGFDAAVNSGLLLFRDLSGQLHSVDVNMGNVSFLQNPHYLKPPSLQEFVQILNTMGPEKKAEFKKLLELYKHIEEKG